MNSTHPAVPGLLSLYRNDLIISRAARLAFFGLVIVAGMWWVSQPQPNATVRDAADVAFDAAAMRWGAVAGAVMTVVSLLVVLWRWLRVRKIFTEGTVIKALVDDLEVRSVEMTNKDSMTNQKTTRRSYFATLRYTVQDKEHTVRIKMPNSGIVFGLVKGKEADVVVHASLPDKPLIRSVYLGRS